MTMTEAYLRAKGHKGKENAVKQKVLQEEVGLTRREMRADVEKVNGDQKSKTLISFNNNGIYIVESQEEIRTMKNRAIRAIQRNSDRVKKADILLNEVTQLSFAIEWDDNTITSQ